MLNPFLLFCLSAFRVESLQDPPEIKPTKQTPSTLSPSVSLFCQNPRITRANGEKQTTRHNDTRAA